MGGKGGTGGMGGTGGKGGKGGTGGTGGTGGKIGTGGMGGILTGKIGNGRNFRDPGYVCIGWDTMELGHIAILGQTTSNKHGLVLLSPLFLPKPESS